MVAIVTDALMRMGEPQVLDLEDVMIIYSDEIDL